MFSCWVVITEPIAVKYVKKHENFEETSLMLVKENNWKYNNPVYFE